ncbi:MAG: helix-turn-helix domain-containing protein [Elusimicrobia bacterium]|nr:helix-turn-helix domain-containing protein [Elusimicrobiota bacterium]
MKKTLISQRIRELRKQKGLTQKRLSQKFNTNPKYITQLEAGYRSPSSKLLKKFAEFFNVPLSYFLDENISIDKGNIVSLPLIKKVKLGEPIISKENIKGYIPLGKEISEDGTFLWKINDDSDEFFRKDDVLIVRQQPFVKRGDFALAIEPDEDEPHVIVPEKFIHSKHKLNIYTALTVREKKVLYKGNLKKSKNTIILGKVIGFYGKL